jgi:hypothetical protein
MKTEELIDSLVVELRPTSPLHIANRIAIGVGAGAVISVLLLFQLLGARPDLAMVMGSTAYWSKVAFTMSMAGASLVIISRLARPEADSRDLWILAVPLLLYLPLGILELIKTDRADWGPMLFGHGWRHCTWMVLGLSIPVFIGLLWSFRQFAPTRIHLAGAVAGICSGAVASVVYCLHCPTDAAVFALTWYTLAFGLAGLAGAAIGRRLLHW